MASQQIGFIGLGNMGGRMARCLARHDRPVLGFDLKAANVAAAEASAAGSAGAVVAATETVLVSLPDSRAVGAVMHGADGILAHARSGQVIVDLGTSSPTSTRALHDLLAARGAAYLDAGISGGAAAAETGSLTLMVGGSGAALDRIRDVLACFATNIFHLGESGAGHTAKLLNNFLNAVSLAATAEVMVAGRKAGLDLAVLLDVINKSSGVNYASTHRFPKIIRGDYLKGGLTNALMMKDVMLYAELAGQLGVPSLNAAGPVASFGLAIARGYADEISNKVVDAIGDIAGGVRLHEGEKP